MSLDRSLKVTSGNLAQHRNVLKRSERLERLKREKGYKPQEQGALGLPKTRNIRLKAGK